MDLSCIKMSNAFAVARAIFLMYCIFLDLHEPETHISLVNAWLLPMKRQHIVLVCTD